jgi:hypothetical protein
MAENSNSGELGFIEMPAPASLTGLLPAMHEKIIGLPAAK